MMSSAKQIGAAVGLILSLLLVAPTWAWAQSADDGGTQAESAQPEGDPLEQARVQAAEGDTAAAVETLDSVVASDVEEGEKVQARYLKGMVLLGAGDKLGARNTFLGLVEDYPELPEPYNNLAAIYASDGELERARELLLEALEYQPDYAVGYENLGDVYAKMATDAYTRASELSEQPGRLPEKLELLSRLFESGS